MTIPDFDDVIFSATLVPHRSLNRRGFLLVMGGIAGLWFLLGLMFWRLGAWPIVGFGGLDILAIYIAFKVNFRAARSYEEISVSRADICIRKVAASGRAQELHFNPQWARLEVEELVDEGVTHVTLRARDARVPVGQFLNPDDRRSFAHAFGAALASARQ